MTRLRERLESHPESRLFLSLSEELWKRGRDEEAFALAQEGIEKDPSFVYAKVRLGRWLLERGRYSQAEQMFAEAAALYSDMINESPEDEMAMKRREELLELIEGVKRAETLDSFLGEIKSRFGDQ